MEPSPDRRIERLDRGIRVRAESVYALSSVRELAYLAAPRALLIGGLLLLPVLLIPYPYWGRVALSVCVMALLAISFDFLASFAGLVCLGGAFFYGVGAYGAAVASATWGLPTALSIPLATVVGAAFCTLLIRPCLPLRGIYFAIVTLMYPLLMARIIEAGDVLGGTVGLGGVAGFGSEWVEAYGLVGATLLFLFGLRRLADEDVGLVIRATGEDDQAVRAAGIDVTAVRTRAVFLAALPACFAGAWYTHLYQGAGISSFALDLSIMPIAAAVIGGTGTLAGGVVGALILVPLSELLRDFGSLRIVLYALLLTGFVVLRSEGLLNWAARKYHQFERRVDA